MNELLAMMSLLLFMITFVAAILAILNNKYIPLFVFLTLVFSINLLITQKIIKNSNNNAVLQKTEQIKKESIGR